MTNKQLAHNAIPAFDKHVEQRFFWTDVCRIVATYGVILIHTCGMEFYRYGAIPLDDWLVVNFLDSAVRAAVPLFVMISGALLLSLSAKQLVMPLEIKRRIEKTLVPLIIWSIIYLWWIDRDKPNGAFILEELVHKFFIGPVMYHLWFVYMIICLYMLLPVLQMIFIACNAHIKLAYCFYCLLFVNSISVYLLPPFIESIALATVFGFGGYFILGGLLGAMPLGVGRIKWVLIYLAGAMTTFLITWIRTSHLSVPDEVGYSYFSPNVLVAAIGAFMFIRKMRSLSGTVTRIVRWASEASFFVFFIHVLVLELLRHGIFEGSFSFDKLSLGLSISLLALVTFVTSMLIAGLVRLIPGSRRVLG